MSKVNYINGKWRLSPKARESGEFVYRDGDWYPETKKKTNPNPEKETKKMNCGTFPLGKIKETCRMLTLYILSGALGMSLAFNLIWYIEKRNTEKENLELLEILQEKK